MTSFQKIGVIFITVIFLILQKIKLQNYRLFMLYDRRESLHFLNSTEFLNGSDTFLADYWKDTVYRCLLVSNCLAIVPCIFLSTWSDKHGRKGLFYVSYCGSIINDIFMLVILFTPSSMKKLLLLSEGISGFLGGNILIAVGCLCYLTDSTDHRGRTLTIAVFIGLYNFIPSIDISLQYFSLSLTDMFSLQAIILNGILGRTLLSLCMLFYIRKGISESVFILGTFQGNPWMNLVTPINVSDAVSCIFKRRLDNIRYFIIALSAIFVLYSITLYGNVSLFPRYFWSVFHWPYKSTLIFIAIFAVSQTLTLWFASYLATQWRALDVELGSYGCASLAISCLILSLGKRDYIAAVGVLAGIGSLLVPVSLLSMLSKLTERNETGSLYAAVGFLALTTQLLSIFSYDQLEVMCADVEIPQLVFLLSFGLTVFASFFYIYLRTNVSPHLLGHLNGDESLALINRRGQIEQLFQ